MRKKTPCSSVSSNLGACFAYYLAILFLGRLYPTQLLPLLLGGSVVWVLLPYTELFLQRMTRPIPRAKPNKSERFLIASALLKIKPQ